MGDSLNYAEQYDAFWKDIVEHPDGTLNRDQVMRELHDFHMVTAQVCQVYDHITNGRISKPNTMAFEVIGQADEHVDELIEAEVRESPAAEFARWVISLDDQDGPGREARRSMTVAQIIDTARDFLAGESEPADRGKRAIAARPGILHRLLERARARWARPARCATCGELPFDGTLPDWHEQLPICLDCGGPLLALWPID